MKYQSEPVIEVSLLHLLLHNPQPAVKIISCPYRTLPVRALTFSASEDPASG
jgi:hypothetical protein